MESGLLPSRAGRLSDLVDLAPQPSTSWRAAVGCDKAMQLLSPDHTHATLMLCRTQHSLLTAGRPQKHKKYPRYLSRQPWRSSYRPVCQNPAFGAYCTVSSLTRLTPIPTTDCSNSQSLLTQSASRRNDPSLRHCTRHFSPYAL